MGQYVSHTQCTKTGVVQLWLLLNRSRKYGERKSRTAHTQGDREQNQGKGIAEVALVLPDVSKAMSRWGECTLWSSRIWSSSPTSWNVYTSVHHCLKASSTTSQSKIANVLKSLYRSKPRRHDNACCHRSDPELARGTELSSGIHVKASGFLIWQRLWDVGKLTFRS